MQTRLQGTLLLTLPCAQFLATIALPQKATFSVSSDGSRLKLVKFLRLLTTFVRFKSSFESDVW